MSDWKQLAAIVAPDIPAEQMDRIAPVLDGLQEQLKRLSARMPEAPASAIVFQAQEAE